MNTKTPIHFAHQYLLRPYNPLTVHLIGAGGTGSQMLTALARINQSLITLGHAGLQLTVFDDDTVSEANLGRQLFAGCELGLPKAVALINRVNRFFGTNWKAVTKRFEATAARQLPDRGCANLFISCVDTVAARYDIAGVVTGYRNARELGRNKALYWMDCGNAQYTGQVVLATISDIPQPKSEQFEPVAILPMMTEEFKPLLDREVDNTAPSCSLAEALLKQDLFINSTIASLGASLLWQLFREGMSENRGFFVNVKDFRTQPLKVA